MHTKKFPILLVLRAHLRMLFEPVFWHSSNLIVGGQNMSRKHSNNFFEVIKMTQGNLDVNNTKY